MDDGVKAVQPYLQVRPWRHIQRHRITNIFAFALESEVAHGSMTRAKESQRWERLLIRAFRNFR